MNLNDKQKNFVELVVKEFGTDTITRQQGIEVETKNGLTRQSWLYNNLKYRAGRGLYNLPVDGPVNSAPVVKSVKQDLPKSNQNQVAQEHVTLQSTASTADNLVPVKESTFVSFGNYKDIKNIISKKIIL